MTLRRQVTQVTCLSRWLRGAKSIVCVADMDTEETGLA